MSLDCSILIAPDNFMSSDLQSILLATPTSYNKHELKSYWYTLIFPLILSQEINILASPS